MIEAKRKQLNAWRTLSLPADVNCASREYEKYLRDTLSQSKFADTFSVKRACCAPKPERSGGSQQETTAHHDPDLHGRGPCHAGQPGYVPGKFYKTPLLHQIKKLRIQRPQTAQQGKPDELGINMTIEALFCRLRRTGTRCCPKNPPEFHVLGRIRHGTTRTLPAKTSFSAELSVASSGPSWWDDPTKFIYLTDITHWGDQWEANLYDRANKLTQHIIPKMACRRRVRFL